MFYSTYLFIEEMLQLVIIGVTEEMEMIGIALIQTVWNWNKRKF